MKKSQYRASDHQDTERTRTIKILSEQEQGKSVSDSCRAHGISQPTLLQLEE